jgi:hypothetical protein
MVGGRTEKTASHNGQLSDPDAEGVASKIRLHSGQVCFCVMAWLFLPILPEMA